MARVDVRATSKEEVGVRHASELSITELASVLARAYLRLLAAGRRVPQIAAVSRSGESPANSPIPLDVAGPAKRELDPEGLA